ncbi:MAG: DMT family transporter, partial [Phycisphaerae bacterium]|nr:DMT family transporter [Phycisphaerae bacterium]NIX27321.1 EamA family transporter [Phycisphaerae bacterium]
MLLSFYSYRVGEILSVNRKPLIVKGQLRQLENTPLVMTSLLILDSLHLVFARLLLPYFPPTTSSLYVMAIATVEVALILKIWGHIRFEVLFRHLWFFLSIGFLVGSSTILTFMAVAFIDPGTGSLLLKSSIVFSVGLGVVWLRERLASIQTIGAIIALAGAVIITFQPGDYLRLGSFIILAAAFMYALHNALFKRYGGGINLPDFFLFRLGGTTAFLLFVAIARNELSMPPSWQAWAILFLTGTVNIVLSRGLYYLTLKRLNLSLHAIILTLSPVVAVGWTILLFGIWPTLQQLIGGTAVIAGVLMTVG